jgi:hypothetical protein
MKPGYLGLLLSLLACTILLALQGFSHGSDPMGLSSLTASGGILLLMVRHFLRAVVDAAMEHDEH